MDKSKLPGLTESPVRGITGVWKFERAGDLKGKTRSPPEHLIHLYIEGEVSVKVKDGVYKAGKGDIFYYYNSEQVETYFHSDTVFYSVGFSAPSLPPLPAEKRMISTDEKMRSYFEEIYNAYLMPHSLYRSVLMHAALHRVILEIDKKSQRLHLSAESKWDEIENKARSRKMYRPGIDELADIAKISRAGVTRRCRKTTGKSPLQRFREIRMAEASALLKYSHMNISEVAEYLGYPRIHEFSREFSAYFGFPPSALKK